MEREGEKEGKGEVGEEEKIKGEEKAERKKI